MTAQLNPFEHAGANDLPEDMLLDYYIEDHNYSRFIKSRRNILLVGERGCGKSMTLRYNSWLLQRLRTARENEPTPFDHIGVYVPCNTHLVHTREYELLKPFHAQALSEHTLVLSIMYFIAETLALDKTLLDEVDVDMLRSRLSYILGEDLPSGMPFFHAVMDFAQHANRRTQTSVTDSTTPEVRLTGTYSFSSLIVPFLSVTRSIPRLKNSHFLIMVDDAHDLNNQQRAALSSWIAYRDHSLFSFKVAIANLSGRKLLTKSGGAILEGHDYIRLDMAQPYQNELSDFGKLADKLIRARLARFGISSTPSEFFPVTKQLTEDLQSAESEVRKLAEEKFGSDARGVADYVYKYKRACYFRKRSPKANRPEYSGFTTLAFLSTGVIRNLLIPCYSMYDKVLSDSSKSEPQAAIERIEPGIQSDVIIDQSTRLWDWLREGIDQNIAGCSREDGTSCYQMLDQLAILFRKRLLKHKSEPRANSFTLSSRTEEVMLRLERLFGILREAQLLYVRSGSAKEEGRREWYYVPIRSLWPDRGLDPHGQHARVSIRADDLWAAAAHNQPLPFDVPDDGDTLELFDEKH